ncbi:FkbM family methyltransferase [Mycobacterium sp. IS-1590]|uniref:FkbM family methyltransferase n=1 Tax=Mycobacterium sp. IS-1590 TaxID=1772286 RepID=UPI000A7AF9F0|nr:FkbM family methyltransferase [Mycobacterium sp. IS-1590]
MMEARIIALCRWYIRFLRTDKESVGLTEQWARKVLLILPFYAVSFFLYLRVALRGPLILDCTTEDGIRVRCRPPDLIQMYLYLFGTWEPDMAAFMRRRLRLGDTFIDVGANIGCVSALASRLVGPSGIVVAIEPSPPVIAALQETVSLNGLTNVRVVTAAVSDREDDLPLFAGPSSNIGLTTTVAHGGLREQGLVRAAPLGSLVSQAELATARLIKIDVEGAEDRVLAGMLALVDALAADAELVVELSPSWWSDKTLRPIDVLRPFLDRGFHVYLLPNEYWPWRYLWPRNVSAPQRLRDLTVLQRVTRLDIVLSRCDTDAL